MLCTEPILSLPRTRGRQLDAGSGALANGHSLEGACRASHQAAVGGQWMMSNGGGCRRCMSKGEREPAAPVRRDQHPPAAAGGLVAWLGDF